MSENELLTTKQAAAELGLSTGRVHAICRRGKLGRKHGREYIITRQELDRFKLLERNPGRPKKQ